MERIDGLPLDAFCDSRRSTVEERLALFLKVCGAVQYAHRNLLIHRDLKPSNILVDNEGEPKLLDFGIAKRLAAEAGVAAQPTRFDARPLTPSHASPEQVRGTAITTASDVYSLGVLLYRLLTGLGPYGSAPRQELERAICERLPARPSAVVLGRGRLEMGAESESGGERELGTEETRARARRLAPQRLSWRLRGDLDTIVLKALAKEPERRYRSVAELAEDVERHLASRPIAARPDTATYLAWKFARRHRAAVLFAATLVSLLVVWIVDLEVQQRRLGREKRRAQQALAFLVEAFQRAGPPTAPGAPVPATAVLDSAARSIERDLAAQPEMQARLMTSIGLAYWDLRRETDASRLFERALAIRLAQGDRVSKEVAQGWELVAITRQARDDLASATAAARHAVELQRKLDPADSVGLASSLNVLGDILSTRKPSPEAERLLEEAVRLAQRGGGEEAGRLAHYLISLGRAKLALSKDQEAERLYRRAFLLQRRSLSPDDPLLLYNEQKFAFALSRLGRSREAESRLRRIAGRQMALAVPETDRAATLGNLSSVLESAGKLDEAIAVRREMLSILMRHLGPRDLRTSGAQQAMARLLFTSGRLDEGRRLADQALATNRKVAGDRSMSTAGTLLTLANFERGAKRYERGIELASECLSIFEEWLGADHWLLVNPLREIAGGLMEQKKFAAALPHLERARALLVRADSKVSAQRSMTDVMLAQALIRVGRGEEAGPILRDSERRLTAEFGPADSRLVCIRNLLKVVDQLAHTRQMRTAL
jgi:serine/threonine-protein kinase